MAPANPINPHRKPRGKALKHAYASLARIENGDLDYFDEALLEHVIRGEEPSYDHLDDEKFLAHIEARYGKAFRNRFVAYQDAYNERLREIAEQSRLPDGSLLAEIEEELRHAVRTRYERDLLLFKTRIEFGLELPSKIRTDEQAEFLRQKADALDAFAESVADGPEQDVEVEQDRLHYLTLANIVDCRSEKERQAHADGIVMRSLIPDAGYSLERARALFHEEYGREPRDLSKRQIQLIDAIRNRRNRREVRETKHAAKDFRRQIKTLIEHPDRDRQTIADWRRNARKGGWLQAPARPVIEEAERDRTESRARGSTGG